MSQSTLENRLVISPGDGLVIAPCSALPISFTLEMKKSLPVQVLSLPDATVSLSCEGKNITQDKLERIDIKTKKKRLTFTFEYVPFTDADRTIDLSLPERKKMDTDLIQETAYSIIHGKQSLNSQIQSLFDYVYRLPALGTKGHPFESDQVIRYGIALKCADKAQLFVDLCRGVDIPARCEDGIHGLGNNHHRWASYFDSTKIQLVDPSLGYRASDFPRSHYFGTGSVFLRLPLGEEGNWKIQWDDPNVSPVPYPTTFFTPFVEHNIFDGAKTRVVRI